MLASIIKKICLIFKNIKKNKLKYECIKICLIYFMIGFVWVYFTDKISYKFINDRNLLLTIHIYKGVLYVVVTSIILYLLINSLVKKVNLSEKKLNESYKELSEVNEELEAYVQQLTASDEQLRIQYDEIIESKKKLSKSEEKNKAIIKAMPDLLFVIDNDGYFIDCMAGDENVLLRPREFFIGKSIFEVIPEEISKIAYEKIQSVFKYGLLESFEYELKISNKKQQFEIRMVKNNKKEILAISRDVTIKRQNELELKISEEKYRTLVNEMKQGLALYEGSVNDRKVIDYRLLNANRSYEKIMGLNAEDILEKTIFEIFPNIESNYIKKLEHAAKTGQTISYERYVQEDDSYYELIAYRPKELQIAVIVNNITKRKKIEESLKASEHNFRNIFEGSSDAIFIISDDKVVDCNLAMVKILGYNSKLSILGKSPFEFYPEKQPDGENSQKKVFKMRKYTMENGKCKFEWWYKRVDGNLLPVEVMLTTIFLNGKRVLHSLWRDISERKQMEKKMEYLSYHDQLTGLYNRRFFEEELNRLDVQRNLPLTIVMGDVNGLKLVNDSFGHSIGDKLLKKVAEVMKMGCRADDIIARLGGDEFVILLTKTDIYETEQILKRIKSIALKEKIGAVDISISFGYETKKDERVSSEEVLKKAEDYMYKKKLFEGPSMRGKTISAIISTLHEKNKREEQHSLRVSGLCQNMGEVLDLPEGEIEELKTVGLLHDIGKIAIEENILNKNGKLTDDEWKEVKRHPEIGYRILNTVNDMSEISEYVLAHHERWDGKGYPRGLKGEKIPLQSRIIAIADSYDAMISERSYRSALPEKVAIKELKINAGIQFDPVLVRIFIEKVLHKSFD